MKLTCAHRTTHAIRRAQNAAHDEKGVPWPERCDASPYVNVLYSAELVQSAPRMWFSGVMSVVGLHSVGCASRNLWAIFVFLWGYCGTLTTVGALVFLVFLRWCGLSNWW